MIPDVLISLSGGLDSTVLLAETLKTGKSVKAVGFNYGSKHNRFENAAAAAIASYFDVPFILIDLTGVMAGFHSVLMLSASTPLPKGHYEEESMRQTVVPGRNLIFLSILAGIAESEGIPEVRLGVHAGDHFIYPDCRPDFVQSAAETVHWSTDGKVAINAPYLNMDKAEIVRVGLVVGAPFEMTRTCYAFQSLACGKCGSCQERLHAFGDNDAVDPIVYVGNRTLIPKSK